MLLLVINASSTGIANREKPQMYSAQRNKQVLLPDLGNLLEIEFEPRNTGWAHFFLKGRCLMLPDLLRD